MKFRKWGLVLLTAMFCLLPAAQTGHAAAAKATKTTTSSKTTAKKSTAQKPTSIKLSKTSYTTVPGKTYTLKATISPKSAAGAKVTWKSSNEKVAQVDAKGKVTIVGIGSASIVATTENGKKAVCKITAKRYIKDSSKLTIWTNGQLRTYKIYNQTRILDSRRRRIGYYSGYGCVVTAVAIIASSCKDKDGKLHSYTPRDIHEGSEKAKYSERYAIKKMGKKSALKQYGSTAISLYTASEILKNIGIENKAVYTFKKAEAEKEIREHLKQGKPVIVKVNNKIHNGIRLANVHHALVLVGIDSKGYVIYINPTGRNPKIKLSTLVQYHMTSPTGKYKTAYVNKRMAGTTAGGYILVE